MINLVPPILLLAVGIGDFFLFFGMHKHGYVYETNQAVALIEAITGLVIALVGLTYLIVRCIILARQGRDETIREEDNKVKR